MPGVNVRDIPAIRDFRAAVQMFLDEANAALQAIQRELQRAFDWVDHDRPHYWQGQLRRGFDLVAQTRIALTTCQMRTVAGRRPSCIEEKQAHDAAKRRLQHCQEQIERVRKWGIKIHHDADELRGRLATLTRCLEQDIPKLIALLDRTVTILDAYSETAASTEETPPGG